MPRDFVLHIPGEVGGKGRPRTRIIFPASGFVPDKSEIQAALAGPGWLDKLRHWFSGKPIATIYPDPDSAREERMIKGLAYAAMRGQALFDCPVELTVEVYRNHPKSWPRRMKESAAGLFCTGKPDVDNLVKLIGDAFNETVWRDDSLIADLIVRRRFADFPPSVVVRVKELVRSEADLFAASVSR
jgi:Holliday junction resolvase RusA-like endonuclease